MLLRLLPTPVPGVVQVLRKNILPGNYIRVVRRLILPVPGSIGLMLILSAQTDFLALIVLFKALVLVEALDLLMWVLVPVLVLRDDQLEALRGRELVFRIYGLLRVIRYPFLVFRGR